MFPAFYYSDAIMSEMASQITVVSIVCSTVWSGANQRKHQSSVSLAFVRGIHRSPVDSPHKRPVTRKLFPFDDVIMYLRPHCYLALTSPAVMYVNNDIGEISQFLAELRNVIFVAAAEALDCSGIEISWALSCGIFRANIFLFALNIISQHWGGAGH